MTNTALNSFIASKNYDTTASNTNTNSNNISNTKTNNTDITNTNTTNSSNTNKNTRTINITNPAKNSNSATSDVMNNDGTNINWKDIKNDSLGIDDSISAKLLDFILKAPVSTNILPNASKSEIDLIIDFLCDSQNLTRSPISTLDSSSPPASTVTQSLRTTNLSASTVAQSTRTTNLSALTVAQSMRTTNLSASTVSQSPRTTNLSASTVTQSLRTTNLSASTVAQSIASTDLSAESWSINRQLNNPAASKIWSINDDDVDAYESPVNFLDQDFSLHSSLSPETNPLRGSYRTKPNPKSPVDLNLDYQIDNYPFYDEFVVETTSHDHVPESRVHDHRCINSNNNYNKNNHRNQNNNSNKNNQNNNNNNNNSNNYRDTLESNVLFYLPDLLDDGELSSDDSEAMPARKKTKREKCNSSSQQELRKERRRAQNRKAANKWRKKKKVPTATLR